MAGGQQRDQAALHQEFLPAARRRGAMETMERWGFMFPGAPWVQKLLPPQTAAEEKLYRKREAEGRRDGMARNP